MRVQSYAFGEFELQPHERRLLRSGSPVPLPPRAFDVLLVLLEHAGSLVTKDELMRRVWRDAVVEEANLGVTVCAVRRAIGHELVATIPKYGYRFSERVEVRAGVPREVIIGSEITEHTEILIKR
jgi:DNA-binding winged helix-turn-helix (wHTH) protein